MRAAWLMSSDSNGETLQQEERGGGGSTDDPRTQGQATNGCRGEERGGEQSFGGMKGQAEWKAEPVMGRGQPGLCITDQRSLLPTGLLHWLARPRDSSRYRECLTRRRVLSGTLPTPIIVGDLPLMANNLSSRFSFIFWNCWVDTNLLDTQWSPCLQYHHSTRFTLFKSASIVTGTAKKV